MALLSFKEKLFGDTLIITFNCEYVEKEGKYGNFLDLQLKNTTNNYFDSGDFRIKIEEAIEKLSENILKEYEEKYRGIRYIAIAQYFLDTLPNVFSVSFETERSNSIYYSEELIKLKK